ncbi:MAG: nucleoside hydrolase [Spirochaetaceae bacterium]|nr:nucleoside hydrolase [Spirochaetaceae bacterium]
MERLILDCDTGQDDAVAILMANGAKNLKIEGIVAVAGNATLENTLENNLKLTEEINLDVPVYKGCSSPLIRKQIIAEGIHGKTGYDGPVFQKKRNKQCMGDGIDFIINTIMENPGEINLVATGPLTDIAMVIKKEPKIIDNVKRIVLMGGALMQGNITPSAEFNIYADPEAAKIVFNSGAEIYMMGLDVTHQVLLNKENFNRFEREQEENPTRVREIFIEGMRAYTKTCVAEIHEYPAMHDPCCIAYLIDPSLFTFQSRDIDVETKGELTYGKTVGLWPNINSKTHVGIGIDADRFFDILSDTLS